MSDLTLVTVISLLAYAMEIQSSLLCSTFIVGYAILLFVPTRSTVIERQGPICNKAGQAQGPARFRGSIDGSSLTSAAAAAPASTWPGRRHRRRP